MKLLLDTHTFLWWDSSPSRLSPMALSLCQDRQNELWLSVVSVWEIQIKTSLGKLQLALSLAELVESQRQQNGIQVLPVYLEHVLALESLPAHHKDPFDRLLIAQSRVEQIPLLSRDPLFEPYEISILW